MEPANLTEEEKDLLCQVVESSNDTYWSIADLIFKENSLSRLKRIENIAQSLAMLGLCKMDQAMSGNFHPVLIPTEKGREVYREIVEQKTNIDQELGL